MKNLRFKFRSAINNSQAFSIKHASSWICHVRENTKTAKKGGKRLSGKKTISLATKGMRIYRHIKNTSLLLVQLLNISLPNLLSALPFPTTQDVSWTPTAGTLGNIILRVVLKPAFDILMLWIASKYFRREASKRSFKKQQTWSCTEAAKTPLRSFFSFFYTDVFSPEW